MHLHLFCVQNLQSNYIIRSLILPCIKLCGQAATRNTISILYVHNILPSLQSNNLVAILFRIRMLNLKNDLSNTQLIFSSVHHKMRILSQMTQVIHTRKVRQIEHVTMAYQQTLRKD